ncbi:MAG: dihydroorotate dehydrogenase electron transfer subunit [Planctomycetes bacterium]|nr:dihydroorotate dehydrogenase electron transfer subunit [Planctomycetota bacterium]
MESGSGAAQVYDEVAPLVARKRVSADTFEMALLCPRIAAAARPGQFVNLLLPSPDFGYRVLEGVAWHESCGRPFLLRRPFSIYRTDRSDQSDRSDGALDTLALLVKEVGEGTRRLGELAIGTSLKVLGPLGNCFRLPPAGTAAALVAGGCGWAGLGMLARELRRLGHPTYAFIGAQSVEALPVETTVGGASLPREPFVEGLPDVCLTSAELESLGVVVALAAESGGKLYRGLVTDLLGAFLRKRGQGGVNVYACGPRAMLARVAELAREHGAPCQVAMEERMACGMGVCNSCVVEVRLPDGTLGHKKLCTDGPVLDAAQVNW